VYRANAQIAVEALLKAVGPKAQVGMTRGVHACMALTALFMLGYGVHLCELTWYNTMAEFPGLRVGIVYMPIPIGGLLTFLFLVEKVWIGTRRKPTSCTATRPRSSSRWTFSFFLALSRSCARSRCRSPTPWASRP